jgi:putative endopeptidase
MIIHRPILHVIAIAVLVPAFVVRAQPSASSPESPFSRSIDPKNIDRTVSPTQDFYRFANGGWLAANPVPPEYARWGSFNELNEKNLADLRTILEAAAANTSAPHGSIDQKVGDFYASAMDSVTAEREGVRPIAEEFARVERIQSISDVAAEIAHQHLGLGNPLFEVGAAQDAKNAAVVITQLYQGGLGLPDRDYYTKEDDKSKQIRQEYLDHMTRMFTIAGDDSSSALMEAKAVMAIETRLAKASMTRVQRRDPEATYHKMSLAELIDIAPKFDWRTYFTSIGLSSTGPINVGQPDFFKEVNAMMTEVSLADWKMYLRWNALDTFAPWLSSPFVNENFHFFGTVLTGAPQNQPRWKRALNAANRSLGEAVGMLYVRKFFPPQAKASARAMVENLRAAFRERLQTRDWMSSSTKSKAISKLDAMNVKIGYPDKWRDYSALKIDRSSIVANIMRATEFESQRQLRQIGKPVDRSEWHMTPPTVNAYYNPYLNEIVFPAGILQPPFFNPHADDAVNYGGMGAVIGHEMTHGFDDQGSKFDADGNLKDWWTASDKIAFEARSQLLEKQFDGYIGIDSIHVNGKLTLGENIADLGGLTIAYAALKKAEQGKPPVPLIDGFTQDQRFFLAWAQIWRANYRDEEIRRRLIIDPHALSQFRTNGPLSDMPEFQLAFHAEDGDPMVRPEKLRPRIW